MDLHNRLTTTRLQLQPQVSYQGPISLLSSQGEALALATQVFVVATHGSINRELLHQFQATSGSLNLEWLHPSRLSADPGAAALLVAAIIACLIAAVLEEVVVAEALGAVEAVILEGEVFIVEAAAEEAAACLQ